MHPCLFADMCVCTAPHRLKRVQECVAARLPALLLLPGAADESWKEGERGRWGGYRCSKQRGEASSRSRHRVHPLTYLCQCTLQLFTITPLPQKPASFRLSLFLLLSPSQSVFKDCCFASSVYVPLKDLFHVWTLISLLHRREGDLKKERRISKPTDGGYSVCVCIDGERRRKPWNIYGCIVHSARCVPNYSLLFVVWVSVSLLWWTCLSVTCVAYLSCEIF